MAAPMGREPDERPPEFILEEQVLKYLQDKTGEITEPEIDLTSPRNIRAVQRAIGEMVFLKIGTENPDRAEKIRTLSEKLAGRYGPRPVDDEF